MSKNQHQGQAALPSMPVFAALGVMIVLLVSLMVAGLPDGTRAQTGPHNIIILVGDGMGPQQVAAAGMY